MPTFLGHEAGEQITVVTDRGKSVEGVQQYRELAGTLRLARPPMVELKERDEEGRPQYGPEPSAKAQLDADPRWELITADGVIGVDPEKTEVKD